MITGTWDRSFRTLLTLTPLSLCPLSLSQSVCVCTVSLCSAWSGWALRYSLAPPMSKLTNQLESNLTACISGCLTVCIPVCLTVCLSHTQPADIRISDVMSAALSVVVLGHAMAVAIIRQFHSPPSAPHSFVSSPTLCADRSLHPRSRAI